MRKNFYLPSTCNPISVKDIAKIMYYQPHSINNYELGVKPLDDYLLKKFAEYYKIDISVLQALNTSAYMPGIIESDALYEIFKVTRSYQSVSTDINRVLSMIRIVSGNFKLKKFVEALNTAFPNYHWNLTTEITALETPGTLPDDNQLMAYFIYFNIPINLLKFWRDEPYAKDEKKKEILYKIYVRAREIYNENY